MLHGGLIHTCSMCAPAELSPARDSCIYITGGVETSLSTGFLCADLCRRQRVYFLVKSCPYRKQSGWDRCMSSCSESTVSKIFIIHSKIILMFCNLIFCVLAFHCITTYLYIYIYIYALKHCLKKLFWMEELSSKPALQNNRFLVLHLLLKTHFYTFLKRYLQEIFLCKEKTIKLFTLCLNVLLLNFSDLHNIH